MADLIRIWMSHMGNHTTTKAESLQAKRDILVPQSLLLGCPASAALIHTAHLCHCQKTKIRTVSLDRHSDFHFFSF